MQLQKRLNACGNRNGENQKSRGGHEWNIEI